MVLRNMWLAYFMSTLIWVGFLGACFEVEWEGVVKLIRIMLKTYNLARMYTSICSFKKCPFSTKELLTFADVSIFLQKN